MLKIRIKDSDTLEYAHRTQKFGKMNRRKSMIVGFNIVNGMTNFILAELETKMIPKKNKKDFCDISFKTLNLESGKSLSIQDPGESLNFLKHSESKLIPIKFNDITEDDEIAIYDSLNKDWGIECVESIEIAKKGTYDDESYSQIEDAIAVGLNKEYSSYMIRADHGIILNGVLVI